MTQDPNVTTDPETGEEVVLEPGDPGYVEPAEEIPPDPVPPGEDLRYVNEPGQSESEAILANRGSVVESTSPTDIVPNTPQIRPMGAQSPIEQAVAEENAAAAEAAAAEAEEDEEETTL